RSAGCIANRNRGSECDGRECRGETWAFLRKKLEAESQKLEAEAGSRDFQLPASSFQRLVIEAGSTDPVVRRLFRNLHVMHVRFGHAGASDAHKLRPRTHLVDSGATGITHGGAQAAHKLMDDSRQRALVRYATLDTF